MADQKLREWRGVKLVAAPAGVAITSRLRTSAEDEYVLDHVAAHLGRLRRADLAATSQRDPVDSRLGAEQRRQVRRDQLNARKKVLTAQSSARWANAIIAGNDDQYCLARAAQYRHIMGLRAAIAAIEKRLAAPSTDTLTGAERKARRKAKGPKGYATQHERFTKQQRLQALRGQLARAEEDRRNQRVRVTEGGKRLIRTRRHLDQAGLTVAEWTQKWAAAHWRSTANGSPDEPFGNLTITVTPTGEVSVRLPKPLEHLANAPRGRYVLSAPAVFPHRGHAPARSALSASPRGQHRVSSHRTHRPDEPRARAVVDSSAVAVAGPHDVQPEYAHDPLLGPPGAGNALSQQWAGGLSLTNPEVSPLYGSLKNLPPTYVYSGSLDQLPPRSWCCSSRRSPKARTSTSS
jgi:hypothetical protein